MGTDDGLIDLPALVLRERMAAGALRAAEVAEAAIARVASADGSALWCDVDRCRRQVMALAAYRGSGRPLGPLHGVPVIVEDSIAAARTAQRHVFLSRDDHVPDQDSAIVERLRTSGAATVARGAPLGFTPDARTDGEVDSAIKDWPNQPIAAAIADRRASAAIACDADASLIRAAGDHGIVGFRPSFGSISRRGVQALAPSLDAPGVLARSLTDAAMVADPLFGQDPADVATSDQPSQRLLEHAQSVPPIKPTLAFLAAPWQNLADGQTSSAFAELQDILGERAFEVALPALFAEGPVQARRVLYAEVAKCLHGLRERRGEALPATLLRALDHGNTILARDYISALDWRHVLYGALDTILLRCDAVVAPAGPGSRQHGAKDADAMAFNRVWAFLGAPCVTLPLLWGEDDRPIGVQLVGRRGEDARLLRTAAWLTQFVENAGAAP